MTPFMFVIDGTPLPQNHNYSKVAGAKIHIWVMDDNMDSARSKAISLINNSLWEIQGIEYAFEMLQEQISELDKLEVQLYQKALRLGIAALFVAYLETDGHPGDPVIIGHP